MSIEQSGKDREWEIALRDAEETSRDLNENIESLTQGDEDHCDEHHAKVDKPAERIVQQIMMTAWPDQKSTASDYILCIIYLTSQLVMQLRTVG